MEEERKRGCLEPWEEEEEQEGNGRCGEKEGEAERRGGRKEGRQVRG